MKPLKSILLVCMLAIITFGCITKHNKGVIKIGAVLDLTGESAYLGKNTQKGADLAIKEINEKGGILGDSVVIIYEDSKGNPTFAAKAISKLIDIDKVQCVIGDVTSADILAMCPIAEKNKVILLNFGVSTDITNAGEYIFRNWSSSSADAKITSAFATKSSKNFVVLYQNDPYGISSMNAFVDELKKVEANIVFKEAFTKGENNFRTLINKFKNVDYDGIYVGCYYKEALQFLTQCKENNIQNVNFYGTSEWEENVLIDFIKNNYPNKVFYGYPIPPDSASVVRKNFLIGFKNSYGNESPGILCDNGYDAIYMLKYGIDKAGIYDATKIKDALYTLKDFEGASAIMSFDENGDVIKPFGLRTINNNGLIWSKEK